MSVASHARHLRTHMLGVSRTFADARRRAGGHLRTLAAWLDLVAVGLDRGYQDYLLRTSIHDSRLRPVDMWRTTRATSMPGTSRVAAYASSSRNRCVRAGGP